ncbi:MAG TPA: hypothetical protein VF541_21545 [Longimicrobium sp.]|jgi:hypothetical protein
MTSDTRLLVQDSWAAVLERVPAATEAFYSRLADIDARFGGILRGDVASRQELALIRSITKIVEKLGDAADAALREPAPPADARESAEQMMVAGALFCMLEAVLGPRFVPALRSAWMEVFSTHAAEIRAAALRQDGS